MIPHDTRDCPFARHHADWALITGAWTAAAMLAAVPDLHIHWLDDDRHWDTSLIHCSREPVSGKE
jgi:hypothetical protein